MSIGGKILDLHDEITKSEGWRIKTKIRTLELSYYTFKQNNNELKNLLEMYCGNSELAEQLINPERSYEFDSFMAEITRLFHNYLAAAKTLIDHTRKFFQDEYKNSNFEREYNEKINETFTHSTISKFIQDIRNYSLHRTLPVSSATIEYVPGKDITHRINLDGEELIKWDKWTKKGKDYLKQKGKRIDMLQMIEEYSIKVVSFQNWFNNKQQEIHKIDLDHLYRMQLKYNVLYEDMNKIISEKIKDK